MNKTSTIFGVIIVILLIIGGVYYSTQVLPVTDDNNLSSSTGVNANSNTPGTVPGNTANSPQPTANLPMTKKPGKPEVITGQTAFPSDTAVTITGGVTPNGTLTTYWFEYGTTADANNKTTIQTLGGGYVLIPAPARITGLRTNTKYYYQLVAENQFGKVTGEQYAFQTTQGTPTRTGSIPTVRTTTANGITSSQVNLNGTIDPNNDATLYWFEYGKNRELGEATIPVSVGAGTLAKPVSGTVPGLEANTTYYFRINAQNDFGTVNGKVLSFKTAR